MKRNWMRRGLKFALFALLAATVFSLVTMSLWNWLLPPLFGLPAITIWQGLGLLMLCRILFGGFGSHGSGSPPSRSRRPEEQERVRQAMCERLGTGRATGESGGTEVNPTTES